MYKTWKVAKVDLDLQLLLAKELGISKVFASVLINRGLINASSALKFLNPALSDLFDPFKLKDMAKTVTRIKKASRDKEHIAIIADYDVDGLTSCAILKTILEKLKLEVSYYIPNRISEGYGLSKQALKHCINSKAKLVFTVDCGITNYKEIDFLKAHNIETIIIDHHQPKDSNLPDACAIIDPKRHDCSYPYKELATVGLVHKLFEALTQERDIHLDLVSLGTVADVVPLDGENRIFVKEGLKHISFPKRTGIKALLEICGLAGKTISTDYINFILGPRINAAGRVRTAHDSLQLLLTDSEEEANILAEKLNSDNRNRQAIQERILKEALAKIDKEINFKDHYVIVLSAAGWHQGVLGIVAAKLVDRFYRPAIIISLEKETGRGSARSIHSFHMFDALSQCSKYLEAFGGHKYAAGITITKDNIEHFRDRINNIAKNSLKPEDLMPLISIDAEIQLSDLGKDLIQELEALSPFGKGNPQPIFCARNLSLKGKPIMVGRDSLKFWVTDGRHFFQAIGFGMSNCLDLVANAKSLDLCFTPRIDSWQGEDSVVLELEDIKFNQE